MYIPGRSRTCSTPSKTVMSAEVYPPSLPALLSFLAVANDPPPARTWQRTPQPMRGLTRGNSIQILPTNRARCPALRQDVSPCATSLSEAPDGPRSALSAPAPRSACPAWCARPDGPATPCSRAPSTSPSNRSRTRRHVPDRLGLGGDVGLVGHGDHDLAPPGQPLRNLARPLRVQGRERIVEEQDGRLLHLGLDCAPQAQAKAQRGRPGLAVGGEGPCPQVPHGKLQVVPVRAHQAGPSSELVVPPLRQPGPERLLQVLPPYRGPVIAGQLGARQTGEFLLCAWGQTGHGIVPKPEERGSVLHQLGVPSLEVIRRSPSLPFLQKSVALSKGPVVRRQHRLLERPERGHGLVHEPATLRRIAPDDVEILRPEERRADLPPKVALAPHRGPVDLDLVRPAPRDLHLDQHPATGGLDLPSEVGRIGPSPDQRLGARGSRRDQEEQERDALDEVGLPLSVGPDHGDQSVRNVIDPGLGVVTEVRELHPQKPQCSAPGWLSRPASAGAPASRDT